MTDNEIMWAFQNGCALISNDDVDSKDISKLKNCLEECAKEMSPIVHKYITGRYCDICTHSDKYGRCTKSNDYTQCFYKIDRPLFVKRRRKYAAH